MSTSASHAFDHAPMANCPFMPVFGPPAIMFERGKGTELWDSNGKRYLDFLAGIAVVSLGHSNPVVAEAVGDQLTCVYVDHGLMRLNETEQVVSLFRGHYNIPLVHVEAEDLFLGKLEGVDDPERKRKIIGGTFIDVFDKLWC